MKLKLLAIAALVCLAASVLTADAGRRGGLPTTIPFQFGIWSDNTSGTAPVLLVEDQLHEISHVHVSPDGTKIAWTRWNVYDPTVGFYTENQSVAGGETFVANSDGTGAISLGFSTKDQGNSAWAPDGSGLYFNSTNNPCGTLAGINFYNLSTKVTTTILYDSVTPCKFSYSDPTVTGAGAGTTLVVGGADTTVQNAQNYLFSYTLAGHVLTQLNTPSIPSFPQSGPGPGDYDPHFNHAGTYVATNRHVGVNCYHVVVTKLSDGTWTDLTDAGQACPTPQGTLSINGNPEFNIADDTLVYWHADPNPANKGIWTIPFAGGASTHVPVALVIPSIGLLKMPTWSTQAASTIYYSSFNITVPNIAPAPTISSVPTLSGTLQVGAGNITASTGTWNNCGGGCTYTYLFYREGSPIGTRSSTNTYAIATTDIGARFSVDVVATNAGGVSSPALSLVSNPVIGATVCYVSFTDGLDTNDCTTSTPGAPHGPIKNISQVNLKTFAAGTSVLFKRGDVWTNDSNATTTITPLSGSVGTAANPIVFDAYGAGALPTLDGSVDGLPSGAGSFTNVGNIWTSVATYAPAQIYTVSYSGAPGANLLVTWSGAQTPSTNAAVRFTTSGTLPTNLSASVTYYIINKSGATTNLALLPGGTAILAGASNGTGTQNGGSNGVAFFDANDPGQLLWSCSARGGSAPAEVNNCSFGKMVGGGAGGVWYKPGDGSAHLGTQNDWNFNTDTFQVQIYSTTNPNTAMPGLRLALDSACFNIGAANSYVIIQNFNCRYVGSSTAIKTLASNFTVRDSVFQWVGGSNNGGASSISSRAGDGITPEGAYNNVMFERIYFFQIYDLISAPQLFSSGQHDNQTIRNCIMDHFSVGNWPELSSTGSFNGFRLYNNTWYSKNSWSWDQRPDSSGHQGWGFRGYSSAISASNLDIRNNIYAGMSNASPYGAILTGGITRDFSYYAPVTINYNSWTADGVNIRISTASADETMATWKSLTSFEANGQIDVDPGFTNASTSSFTPTALAPTRNAGTNLYSAGVVWDFNRNPRPNSGNFTMGAIQ